MINITIGESYVLRTKFAWRGTIRFFGHQCTFSNRGLMFHSIHPTDIRIAALLQQKYPEYFCDFDFYKEGGVEQVMFNTTANAVLDLD